MSSLRFAYRMLVREWRAGEVRVLAVALVISVAALSAAGLFTERLNETLRVHAASFLGADLAIRSDSELPSSWQQAAADFKLKSTRILSFPSMVVFNQHTQLAEVKAVESGYPLRGELRVGSQPYEAGTATRAIPAPNTVWVDTRLYTKLGLQLGSRVQLGEAHFRVAAILINEPDRAGDLFNIAPRILMNRGDVARTQLVQPGSRVAHRLLLSGEAVQRFQARAASFLKPGERLITPGEARPEMRLALQRAEQFLGLAALSSVILSAIAIALSARRFIARHLDDWAIMSCLGATGNSLMRTFLLFFLCLGVLAGALGTALGFLAQLVLAIQLKDLLSLPLVAPSLQPLIRSNITALVVLFSFAVPPLLRVRGLSVNQIFRRDLLTHKRTSWLGYLAGSVILSGLILVQAGSAKLGSYVLAALFGVAIFSAVAALLLLRFVRFINKTSSIDWRYALAALLRHPYSTVIQVAAFAMGIMILLALTLVREDLLREWQKSLPQGAPNRFLINVQPNQTGPITDFLATQLGAHPQFYPMVKARLIAINQRTIDPAQSANPRARRLLEREFNLSSTQDLPSGNVLLAGRWWDKSSALPELSIEQGIAELLGINLYDQLSYQIGNERLIGRVTSIRKVQWESFHVNFFVLASPGAINAYPQTFITSFHLGPGKEPVLTRLAAAFPNLTIIDVAAIMAQVEKAMDQTVRAVQFIFLFTLAAGLMIMYAAVAAGYDERVHEAAVLRTLGATSGRLLRIQFVEFAVLGLLAGGIAALAASLLAYGISREILHVPYQFNLGMWGIALVSGGLGIACAGLVGTWQVGRQPPLQVLYRAAA